MKYVKSKRRTRLTNKYLKAILLVGCTNTKPNLDFINLTKLNFCIDFIRNIGIISFVKFHTVLRLYPAAIVSPHFYLAFMKNVW